MLLQEFINITPSALTKADDTNVTLTLGGTPSTALLQGVSLTLGWTGTLADGRIASASTWNAKIGGSGTTNELAYFTASGTIGSLAVATYPSLTEISYVKGVTSSIQTQIDSKQPTLSLTNTQIYVGNGSNIPTGVALTLSSIGGSFSLANTGVLTMPNADTSTRGLLTSTDWNTFNSKQATLVSGTNIKTVNSSSLLGSGNLAVGDALVANPLSQFASTTSSQLAGVISDETGSGSLVFGSAPTLSNPVVGTQTQNDNSTKAASTAYVDNVVGFLKVYGGTAITGTTSDTYSTGVLIPANTFANGDVIHLGVSYKKTGTAGTLNCRIWINATNNLSGSPVQIGRASISASNVVGGLHRVMMNFTGASSLECYAVNIASNTDFEAAGTIPATVTYDVTTAKYLVVSYQLGSSADTATPLICWISKHR